MRFVRSRVCRAKDDACKGFGGTESRERECEVKITEYNVTSDQNLLFHGGDTFAAHTLITIDHAERTGIYVSCTGSVFKGN